MERRAERLRRLAWWAVFAAAFGAIEATVVVYIRQLLHIVPGEGYLSFISGARNGFGAPGISRALEHAGILQIERLREAGTLLLLFAAACAERTGWRRRTARFLFTFAVWDLSYYVYLAAVVGFPRNLTDRDIYFLVPTAWVGPLWFPALVVMPGLLAVSFWLERGSHKE